MLKNKRFWRGLPVFNVFVLLCYLVPLLILKDSTSEEAGMFFVQIWFFFFFGGFMIGAFICGLMTFRKDESYKTILLYTLFSAGAILIIGSPCLTLTLGETSILLCLVVAAEEGIGFFMGAAIWNWHKKRRDKFEEEQAKK